MTICQPSGPVRSSVAQRTAPIRPADGGSHDDASSVVRLDVGQARPVTPVEVSAEILRVLKARAEAERAFGDLADRQQVHVHRMTIP